ncbi:hypothetical protein [Bradyrhizobium elkanii]|uniref:hypothetical protein n=1 Tax=Bradyrhizobium elkanii TaxID=29448 RepID=UPI0004B9F684|nr:hypothetical protein [Bradyrhizobium elkanii]WLA79569.1 hypothetical protein QNJ99_29755 [Bradyrhizobium elkanii]
MSFTRFRERSRDVQDGVERHVWGEQKYNGKGSHIKVRGTDTEDQEAAVLNIAGVSFNLPKNTNTEVFLLASSSDTNLKVAVLTIPRDKQRRWKEGDGGVQHPTDPEFALDFSDKLAHLTKNKFAVGEKGEFEIKGGEGYFRVSKLIVDGELIVNKRIKTPEVVQGSEKPPGFEGNKQAEINDKDDQQGGGGGASAQLVMDF